MIKYTSLLIATLLAGALTAQDSVRTLFKPAKVHTVGIYIAPEFQYGQIDGSFTTFSGGSAMLLFNRRFAAGVTGQHSLADAFSPASVSPLTVRAGFGGAKVEYTLRPDKALHISFPLVVGMGMVRTDSLNSRNNEDFHHHNEGFAGRGNRGHDYWVIQPGVQLETNLLRNVQVFAGANYRISSNNGSNTTTLPADLMQGFSMSAGVKMGFFDLFGGHRHHRNTPPAAVLGSFMKQFPDAPADIRWHRERKGEWEAEFKVQDTPMSANFAADGQWLETETEVTLADLPAALQTTLKDVKASEFARIQRADGKTIYEVEVKGKDLLFDENGILILN